MSSKKKSWNDKLNANKTHKVKRIDFAFAGIPAGSLMLVATPKIVDAYIRAIPRQTEKTIQEMRAELAKKYKAEYTCPVSTGIFLRIVAEATYERFLLNEPVEKLTPIWRIINEKSSIVKKRSFSALQSNRTGSLHCRAIASG